MTAFQLALPALLFVIASSLGKPYHLAALERGFRVGHGCHSWLQRRIELFMGHMTEVRAIEQGGELGNFGLRPSQLNDRQGDPLLTQTQVAAAVQQLTSGRVDEGEAVIVLRNDALPRYRREAVSVAGIVSYRIRGSRARSRRSACSSACIR